MEWDVLELLGESRGKTSGYVSAVQLNHKETESGISGVNGGRVLSLEKM